MGKELIQAIKASDLVVVETNEPAKDFGRLKRQTIGAAAEQDPQRRVLHYTPASGVEDWESKQHLSAAPELGQALRLSAAGEQGTLFEGPHILVIPHSSRYFGEYNPQSNINVFELEGTLDYYAHRPSEQKATLVFTLSPGEELPREVRTRGKNVKLPPPNEREAGFVFDLYQRGNPRADFVKGESQDLIREMRGMSEDDMQRVLRESISQHRRVGLNPTLEVIRGVKRQIAQETGLLTYIHPESTIRPVGWDYFLENYWGGLAEHKAFQPGNKQRPKLILLVGPPGTGKSVGAFYVATEVGLDGFFVEMQELLGRGGIFGQANRALEVVLDALHRSGGVGVMDEFNRLMAHDPTGRTDAGTTAHLHAGFLTRLQQGGDYTMFGTINNVTGVDAAMFRPGRVSSAWWVGPLSREGLADVALVHLQKFENKGAIRFGKSSKREVAAQIAYYTEQLGTSPAFAAQVVDNLAALTHEITSQAIETAFRVTPRDLEEHATGEEEKKAYQKFEQALPSVFDGLRPLERHQAVERVVDLRLEPTVHHVPQKVTVGQPSGKGGNPFKLS